MLTEPDEIHPRMLKKRSKMICELSAKSLRIHREQKTLQRCEERQEENELLRRSEKNFRKMSESNCFNTSKASKHVIGQFICRDLKLIK